jgi:hypothetical protein
MHPAARATQPPHQPRSDIRKLLIFVLGLNAPTRKS